MTSVQRRSFGRWSLPVVTALGLGVIVLSNREGSASSPSPDSSRVVDTNGRFIDADPMRGRLIVVHHDCGGCHGGDGNPAADNFLVGLRDTTQQFRIGPFITRPRNLTPDNLTGTGRFTERQIFNALRFGLRPGETPDVDITSNTPGEGNFPANPKYLAVPMPWIAFRHMSDQELRDIAAYLKRALKPVVNKVPDSEGPPDFWASAYTPEKIGTYPLAAFPTPNEKAP